MRNLVQADIDKPLGNLVLRDGTAHEIRRVTLDGLQVLQQIKESPNDLALQRAYLAGVLPTCSPEQLGTLTEPVIDEIVLRTRHGIEAMEELLGESSGARTGSISSDSPPGTETPTSLTAMLPATG